MSDLVNKQSYPKGFANNEKINIFIIFIKYDRNSNASKYIITNILIV